MSAAALRGILPTLILLSAATSLAEEIHDSARGFRLRVPDGFHRLDEFEPTPKIPYAFVSGDRSDEVADLVLFVEMLGGTLGREPLKKENMPAGVDGDIFRVPWKGFEIDVFEVREVIEGLPFLTYNVQVPLKKEAIQLKIAGPAERKAELRTTVTTILENLDGESNWIPSILPESRVSGGDDYGKILLAVGLGAFLAGLVGLWVISRMAPRGTVLAIAVAIYSLSWMGGSVRIREVHLLTGTMRLFGVAAGILGIIDLIRKRPALTPPATAASEPIFLDDPHEPPTETAASKP